MLCESEKHLREGKSVLISAKARRVTFEHIGLYWLSKHLQWNILNFEHCPIEKVSK